MKTIQDLLNFSHLPKPLDFNDKYVLMETLIAKHSIKYLTHSDINYILIQISNDDPHITAGSYAICEKTNLTIPTCNSIIREYLEHVKKLP